MAAPSPQLLRLAEQWADCRLCSLHKGRTNVVVGAGPTTAKLMMLGEAPGEQEDLSGTPFWGKSGQLLRAYCLEAGFKAEDCYITNLIGCRPPDNRVPMYDEIELCRPRLEALFWIVQPKVLLIVGGTALMSLTGKQGIHTKRGKWMDVMWMWKGQKQSIKAIATLHPAGLIPGRLKDPADLDKFRNDLKTAWEAANS